MANSEKLEALIEGALWWAERGVPTFPCKGNKAPLTSKSFYDAEVEPTKVRALFEFYGDNAVYVGARMGEASGLFCMDFDLYKGDEPKEYMERLIADGCLPDSRTHKTKNGGLHVFYSSDDEWPNLVPCSGVEVKGEGSYVIVPPSAGYEVLQDGVEEAPASLLAELALARKAASGKTEGDLKIAILDASDFHDSLLGLSAKLAARDVDVVDIVIELKKAMANSSAADPSHDRHLRWKALVIDKGGELTRIAISGYKKYNHDYGDDVYRDAATQKKGVASDMGFTSPGGGSEKTVKAKEYSGEEWPYDTGYFADEDHNLEDQRFTMYPIFAENESVVLFAEPKTGKTAVALTTALHIACGFDLGAFKVSNAGPTLYYALEGSRAIRLRVAAWRKKKAEEGVELPERIPMYVVEGHATFLKEERRQDEANKIIAANGYAINTGAGPLKAVYLDTLTKAMSGGDQNSVEDTSHLFELIGLLRAGGVTATIIFVHHKSRTGNARGSTNIEAEPDVLLDIAKEADIVTMRIARARSIEDGQSFNFKLSGVDLGKTDQGHPLAGVYIEPVNVGENDVVDLGAAQVKARQYAAIIAMGEGEHKLLVVLKAMADAGCALTDERGKSLTSVSGNSKKAMSKLLGSGQGVVYSGVGISIVQGKEFSIRVR